MNTSISSRLRALPGKHAELGEGSRAVRWNRSRLGVSTLAFALLAGCAVAPPVGPTLTALQGRGKDFDQFQRDDFSCRDYAMQRTNRVATTPVMARGGAAPILGTAGGSAAGALIGAAAGNAGRGAAIGAGAGLLLGASAGVQQVRRKEFVLQRQYDNAYAQCITAKGERIVLPQAPVMVAVSAPLIVTVPPVYYYTPR